MTVAFFSTKELGRMEGIVNTISSISESLNIPEFTLCEFCDISQVEYIEMKDVVEERAKDEEGDWDGDWK